MHLFVYMNLAAVNLLSFCCVAHLYR